MDKNYILHLLRVGRLARSFCRLYFKNEEIANEIANIAFMCGLTHDIGKLQVDEKILNKKGKLEEFEFQEIKKHSIYSYELLKAAGFNDYSAIALYHHERYDGKGYPRGLEGDSIPILAKIISICDVFDAMTSERVYRENPISKIDTLNYILSKCGENFEPTLAQYFVENIEDILLENELEDYISA